MKPKAAFSLRLTPDCYIKLKAIAKDETRTINKQVEYILQRYIAKYESEHGEIEITDEQD